MPKKINKIELVNAEPVKKTASEIRNSLNRKFNGKTQLASDKEQIVRMPTGIMELDYVLAGGFPMGKIALLAGGESSYKSTICMKTIAETQKRGGVAAWVDAERAFNKQWAQANGVDLENLLLIEPDTAEEAYDTMTSLINDGVTTIVLDSLNTLSIAKELYEDGKEGKEGDKMASITKNGMGVAQKLTSQWLRTAFGRIEKAKALVLIITQFRDNFNAGTYGNPNTVAGGRAVRFASSVTLLTRIIGGAEGRIMKGTEQVGQKYAVKVDKTRFSKPNAVAEFTTYGPNVDNFNAMLKIGLEKGFIQRLNVKTYSVNNRNFSSKMALLQAFHDEPELFNWCKQQMQIAIDGPLFSYDPYSQDDVAMKEKALQEAREVQGEDFVVPDEEDEIETN